MQSLPEKNQPLTDDWQRVYSVGDCDPCPFCREPLCPHCQKHYDYCDCLGLHEDPDQYEYVCVDWQWYIREISNH